MLHSPPSSLENFDEMHHKCGGCEACRKSHARQLKAQIMHEAHMHDENCVVTLTYDDNHKPRNNSLNKKHGQNFLRDLRKEVFKKYGKRIRFFILGEYGENFARPHYHIILCGFDFQDKEHRTTTESGAKLYKSKLLENNWKFGFADVGDFNESTAGYVSNYVTTKPTGKLADAIFTETDKQTGELIIRVPVYAHGSNRPGLGHDYYIKYQPEIYVQDMILDKNLNPFSPPNYCDKILKRTQPEQYEKVKEKRVNRAEKNIISPKRLNDLEKFNALHLSRAIKRK